MTKPRGIFCGIGVCFDCVVTIDGVPGQRSCVKKVVSGMKVESQ
ncbi:MAG: 2Fe-2S iron-sulfur cluster-binding protein [Actinomycetota bacterium]